MLSNYFDDWEIKPEFHMEFISIFDGWLGKEKLCKLDDVTEKEWMKFNELLREICNRYSCYVVNLNSQTCVYVTDIESVIVSYQDNLERNASTFTRLIIPELDAVLTEDWDFCYILWHRNDKAINAILPLVESTGLYHFNENHT